MADRSNAVADHRGRVASDCRRRLLSAPNCSERVLADVYGAGRLSESGALPAAAITGSMDYVAAMRDVRPPGGRWLRLYRRRHRARPRRSLVGLGRPDAGALRVRLCAREPSGVVAGVFGPLLATERSAARPLLPRSRRRPQVGRPAGGASNSHPEPRARSASTYSEQAYLARYLGFLLVEGDDLVMREGRIFVRTIAGLKRCDVIWRHIDADWCDPLELNASSRIGVPGMLEAIREHGVVRRKHAGNGIPRVARHACLPARACASSSGAGPAHAEHRDLVVRAAAGAGTRSRRVPRDLDCAGVFGSFRDELPGVRGRSSVIGEELSARERDRLRDAIATRGMDYVGQEVVRLSTTPRWVEDGLEPRPFVLRVYCAATRKGWRVMPGGFCRISDRPDARAVSMGDGVESADVWVLAESPVETSTLLPSPDGVRITRLLGNLPSRAADNLFWFGRYLERAEATLRVVRCLAARSVDPDAPMRVGRQALDRLMGVLVGWGAVDATALKEGADAAAAQGLRDSNQSRLSAVACTCSAYGRVGHSGAIDLQDLGADRPSGERDRPRSRPPVVGRGNRRPHRRGANRDRRLVRIVRREFQSRRGLGFLRHGTLRRARRKHLPSAAPVRGQRRDGAHPRRHARSDRLADYLQLSLLGRRRSCAGAGHGVAGPFQSPIRRLSDQSNRRRHRDAARCCAATGSSRSRTGSRPSSSAELTTERAEALDNSRILAIEQRLLTLANAIAARYFLQGAAQGRAEKITGLA